MLLKSLNIKKKITFKEIIFKEVQNQQNPNGKKSKQIKKHKKWTTITIKIAMKNNKIKQNKKQNKNKIKERCLKKKKKNSYL